MRSKKPKRMQPVKAWAVVNCETGELVIAGRFMVDDDKKALHAYSHERFARIEIREVCGRGGQQHVHQYLTDEDGCVHDCRCGHRYEVSR